MPTTNPIVPETAQIGEFGNLPTLEGDGGSIITSYRELKPGSGTLANHIVYQTAKDGSEVITSTIRLTVAIDESGDPKSMTIIMSLIQQGVTVTLSGNRTL